MRYPTPAFDPLSTNLPCSAGHVLLDSADPFELSLAVPCDQNDISLGGVATPSPENWQANGDP